MLNTRADCFGIISRAGNNVGACLASTITLTIRHSKFYITKISTKKKKQNRRKHLQYFELTMLYVYRVDATMEKSKPFKCQTI